jgi:hypothetical protein
MGASQTVLPFKLAATDESLTAHSGLMLFGDMRERWVWTA